MEEDKKTALDRSVKARTRRQVAAISTEIVGEQISRMPPQALDLEEAVLGALLLEKGALERVIDVLQPDHFYPEGHQNIFKAIVWLFNNGQPVDLLMVSEQLRASNELEMVGGLGYLTRLTSRVASAANVEYHARIVVEKAIKREIIRISSLAIRDAHEAGQDVFQLLDKTQGDLFSVGESNIKKNYLDMGSLLRKALAELEGRKGMKDGITGVGSGFTELDRITSGWQPSDLVIIAARPGMGKTAFVLSCARNAAVFFKKPVAIFSLEMSAISLVNRMISAEAEIESDKIRKGTLEQHEWTQLNHKITDLVNAPMFIDDTPALSILELRAKCRRLKAQHDIQMIIIDYLQLMTGDTSKMGSNREQEIASISRALKNLAKELQVPVIALSQLSRDVEKRAGGKRPQLSDLRESGSLEQDADMVIFLYRPEYYGIEQDENNNDLKGIGEVIIAKHRNGSLEDIKLKFIGKYTKFVNRDEENYSGRGFGSAFPAADGVSRFPSEFAAPTGGIAISSRMNTPLPPANTDGEAPF
jgi:replicative DNA helicase